MPSAMSAPLMLTLTATSRPEYLCEVLESLRRCDGIESAVLLPHVEPGNDEVRALIHGRAAEPQLLEAAEQAGLRSMREDGERLVGEGITSAEEVMRVTRE